MMRRQRALADFGDFVLDHDNLDAILMEACRLIAEALDTDFAKVIQIERERQTGLVRAGVGWNDGVVGKERVGLTEGSSEAYAVARAEAVIINDIKKESRFHFPRFLLDHGVVALVNVPIFLPGRRPWGILQVDARVPREFDGDDIEFLKTYSMVLGPVIDRSLVAHEKDEANRQLALRNDRLRRVVDGIDEGFGLLAPDFTILEHNRKFHVTEGDLPAETIGRNFWEVYTDSEDTDIGRMIVRAMQERIPLALEHRPEGSERWLEARAYPIADGTLAMLWRDATDRREERQRLIWSEEWLRSAIRVGKVGLWNWDVAAGTLVWSEEHYRMYGFDVGEVEPSYEVWLSSMHADDRAAAEADLQAAMEGGEDFSCEYRVVRPDGTIRWLSGTGRFFFDTHGAPVRMVGAIVDVTERREMNDRLELLVAELQHRTRNLIGVVQALANRTARASATIEGFTTKFAHRLDAMARVQGLLSRLGTEDRIAFDELIETELAAMKGETADANIRLEGPRGIPLRSSTVQTLALALHELATNAVKYGALGQGSAQLAVTWRFEREGPGGKPWLHVDWRESGVRMPHDKSIPHGSGEGRELIEQALPYQLGGSTSFALTEDGVHCTISIPVSAQ
ncbi:MAG: PAS domain-containing protein [Erythrobacter sp.]|nr:PAS domain-containing protein [Erythrobacter sp.]